MEELSYVVTSCWITTSVATAGRCAGTKVPAAAHLRLVLGVKVIIGIS